MRLLFTKRGFCPIGGSESQVLESIERRGDHFGKNARTGRGAAKIAHELRMRPMRDSGNNDALDVGENLFERCRAFRWRCLQLRQDCAGPGVRRDGTLRDVLTIIRDPICQLMQLFPKFFRRNITKAWPVIHSNGVRLRRGRARRQTPRMSSFRQGWLSDLSDFAAHANFVGHFGEVSLPSRRRRRHVD